MKRFAKIMIAGLATAAMTGTALADDPPADGGGGGDTTGGDTTGGGDAAAPPADPVADPAMAPAGGKTKSIGADVGGVLPLSDYADAVDFGIAVLGRFEFGINEMLAVTGRAGLIYHIGGALGDVDATLISIPIMAGISYKIGTSGLFATAEAGIVYNRVSADAGSESETDFGAIVGAGYQAGKIKGRAGLFLPDLEHAGDAQGILVTVGYDFATL